jgi:hypothetical protein
LRHANGEQLNEAELTWMWNQFAEAGKALVAVAIFALPGGMVLLPALEKLMPEGSTLIPTAFLKPPKPSV